MPGSMPTLTSTQRHQSLNPSHLLLTWLGSAGAPHAGRCFQVLTKAVGMSE